MDELETLSVALDVFVVKVEKNGTATCFIMELLKCVEPTEVSGKETLNSDCFLQQHLKPFSCI